MPLVRISLLEGKPAAQLKKIADAVHAALVETISIPQQDRFQVITEHAATHLIYDPEYLNIRPSEDIVIIQVTLNAGRSLEIKKALYKRMVERLHEKAGLRPEDVFI